MWNVQAGLFSVAVINAGYNIIAEVIGKSHGIDPIVFSTYRDAAAAPILYCLALSQSKERLAPRKEDMPRLVIQGFLGIYLNQILFLVGVQLTNGTIGSICNLTLPVFAAMIGIYSGKEKFRWTTVVGVGFCIFGALIMVLGKHGTSSSSNAENAELGIFVLLFGSFSSALYYVIQKKSLTKYSAVFVTSWEYIFGLGFMLLSALLFADYSPERWQLNKTGVIALTFTVLLNSVAKYLLNSICNKYVSATVLTAFSTLVPVMTGVLAFVLLNAPFELSYLGSFPVVLGIYFVMKARERHQGDSSSSSSSSSSHSYKNVYESDPY